MWHWGRKPPRGVPIDRSHPMAEGLVFFCALHHGSGNQQDLVTGKIGTHINDTDGDIYYNQREGVFITPASNQTAGDDRGWDFGATPGDKSHPWEIDYGVVMCRARPDKAHTDTSPPEGFHSAGSRIISMANNAAGTDDYCIGADDNAGNNNQIFFRARDAAGVGPTLDINRGAGDYLGVLIDAAMEVRPGTTGNVDAHVWEVENNDYKTITGDFTGPIGATGEGLAIAYRRIEERYIGGSIEYCAVFDRPKGFDFIQTFRQNPWQIFEAATEEATGGGEQAGSLLSVGVGY